MTIHIDLSYNDFTQNINKGDISSVFLFTVISKIIHK
jgi:hypothetical protein